MPRRLKFFSILALLIAATLFAALRSQRREVNLSSVRQIYSDSLRDADQPGLRLTRLSDAEEMQLGVNLLQTMPWPEDPVGTQQLVRVAQPLLVHIHRHAITYQFHVVQAPMLNAFALPGGQVIVTNTMLTFTHSDSELAEILGHEIAHVDLRHAVEQYQYQYRLGALAELFHRLATMPFSADQELEADAEGFRLATAAGYNPKAAAAVFVRMQQYFHETAAPPANTPTGELAHSLGDALASYFRTHPPTQERVRRLQALAGTL
jgi:predicted Zn-dependent protease